MRQQYFEKIAGIPTENDVEKSWKFFAENYLPLAEQDITLYDYPTNSVQPKRKEKKKIFRGKNIAAASLFFSYMEYLFQIRIIGAESFFGIFLLRVAAFFCRRQQKCLVLGLSPYGNTLQE